MKQTEYQFSVSTKGRGIYAISNKVESWVQNQNIRSGLLTLFIPHTSASLLIQENADPDVQDDLIDYFNKIVPMNDNYKHIAEGIDDMPSHIKSAMTNNQISLSIKDEKLLLGTWQGLFLFEHRIENQNRSIIHHFIGE